jgi:hypothetical protein
MSESTYWIIKGALNSYFSATSRREDVVLWLRIYKCSKIFLWSTKVLLSMESLEFGFIWGNTISTEYYLLYFATAFVLLLLFDIV